MNKLIAIQSELKAPKGNYNSFGKYKYRSCEDILEAVKPLCLKHECLLTLSDEIVLIGERYYVKATAKITDGENTESATAYARESFDKKGMDESQITGTASSYARKYALNGLLNIDDTKDADTDQHHEQTSQQTAEKPKFEPKPDPKTEPQKSEAPHLNVCVVCGKTVRENLANASQAKYGAVFCSVECFNNPKWQIKEG